MRSATDFGERGRESDKNDNTIGFLSGVAEARHRGLVGIGSGAMSGAECTGGVESNGIGIDEVGCDVGVGMDGHSSSGDDVNDKCDEGDIAGGLPRRAEPRRRHRL